MVGTTSVQRRSGAVRTNHPDVVLLDDAEQVIAADLDVLSPSALGGSITDANVDVVRRP